MSSSAPGEDLLWLMHQLADGDWHSGDPGIDPPAAATLA